jgi:Protein of unknown function (DUF3300)
MERRCSLVRQCIVLILAVCMNLNLANGATGISQGASESVSTPGQLDKLLAPVALYPDALLMQVLAASVNSQEVLDGGNWLLQNKNLQGEQLDTASKAAGFGPAMMALFHFPQVVDMMCSEIDWTKQLGEAFTANQSAVLDAVQRLRLQAKQAGNLQTTPQQTVVTQQASGQQVIVIQPTNPQVIYVPQYNPVTVYAPPPPAPPQNSGVSTGTAVVGALVAFGVGMAVGSMFSSNNYYYPRWGPGGGCYYGGSVWVSKSYAYRPVYGPSYRPATGYYRPPNYPYAYNRPYPGNTHYNSSNYYNNYRGNTTNQNKSNNTINRNVSGNNVTINTGNQVNNQGDKTRNTAANNGNMQSNQSWKGQSTYNGGNKNSGNSSNNASRNPSTTRTPPNSSGQANTQTVKPDRGYSPSSSSGSTASQRSNSRPASTTNTAKAFEGSGNNARSEQASSQRGAASASTRRGNQ